MTTTLTVSIGGNGPHNARLGAREWYAFRLATLHAVRDTGATLVFHATGIGVYNGVSEPSYTVIATLPDAPADAASAARVATLRRTLAQLAHDYRQASIALSHAPGTLTTFVRPTTPAPRVLP